jgi:hypothetical protein
VDAAGGAERTAQNAASGYWERALRAVNAPSSQVVIRFRRPCRHRPHQSGAPEDLRRRTFDDEDPRRDVGRHESGGRMAASPILFSKPPFRN